MSSETSVLILTGPPGVGKTTAAALLADRSGRPAVHLESDAFFRFIRSGSVEPWRPESHEQNTTVMGIVGDAAAAYAAAGYFTIVDGIVIPRWFLAPLRDALQAAGQGVAYVVLRAPLAECAARVDAREGGPLSEPEAIRRIWSQFQGLDAFERHVLDVEGRDPTDVAEALARVLAARSHVL